MRKNSVLIIEDDNFVRELYQRELQKAGIEAEVAVDGEEGIQKAREFRGRLVFLDIMLPKKTGIEVLEIIKDVKATDTNNLTVILLTNLGQENIIKKAFGMGANGYILKARVLPRELVEDVLHFFRNEPLKHTLKDIDLIL